MPLMAILTHSCSLRPTQPTFFSSNSDLRHLNYLSGLHFRLVFPQELKLTVLTHFFNSTRRRIRSFKHEDAEYNEDARSIDTSEIQNRSPDKVVENQENETEDTGSSFLVKLAIALGIATTITILSVCLKQSDQGSSLGIQYLADGSSSSMSGAPSAGFTFKAFGYKVVLPEYPPGWIYFWLLMAAGCGLFISEEALNIWVGTSLARMLSLDGTWHSFVESFYRNAPYIVSTISWVYWGVCISDMVPFYLGKLFRKSGRSGDVYSKLGIGKEKAMSITNVVQKYGNLTGFVERFSIGVRNPTAFLAGALGISPECFFAGVCCGGLFTLPIQLGIGFLLRERPVFTVASVAAVVGIWTLFPYAVAALTALFFYLRGRRST